jgi:heptosyltransferase-2
VHTAIKTFGLLAREYGYDSLSLTIVGNNSASPTYTSYLKSLVKTTGIEMKINFVDFVPREQLLHVYHDHDILIFPSVWDEPFGIVLLEAMSCGLAVVGTGTGGSSEILEGEVNAVVFPKENAEACAKQIKRLLDNPNIFEQIRQNGRRTVEKRFNFEQTIDEIEEVLFKSLNGKQAGSKHYPELANREIVTCKQDENNCPKSPTGFVIIPKTLPVLSSCTNLGRSLYINPRLWMGRLGGLCNVLPRLLLFGCCEIFYRLAGMRAKSRKIDLTLVRNVLVVQLADVGDTVLTGPFLRELRRALPHCWIGLVVQPSIYNLVEECPYVNEVFTYDWRGIKDWETKQFQIDWCLKAFKLARRSLWRRRIDLAISPRWDEDSCQAASIFCMYISGAPRRIGYYANRNKIDPLLTDGPNRGFPGHEVERQLDVLRFLKVEVMSEYLEAWTNQTDETFAEQVMGEYGVNENDLLIAFAPGAGWPKRRWLADRFSEIGQWLQENYRAYILILGNQDDQELGSQMERRLQRELTLNMMGRTTLRQMAALLRHCKLCLANDSGPMHVAAAAGVPVVGLFGSGEYQRFKPWGASHEMVRLGLLCSPCRENCMFDRPYCMEGITVTQIKGVISTRLNLLLRDAQRR